MDSDFVASAVAAIETELAGALVTTPGALREAAEKRRRTLSLEYNRVLASGAFGDGRGYDAAAATATQGDGNSQTRALGSGANRSRARGTSTRSRRDPSSQ